MYIDYFLRYLEVEKKYSKHTIIAYQKDLADFRDFCAENLGQDAIVAVVYSDVRAWIVALVDAEIDNRTINRKISALKSFYSFLQKTDEITENPLARHKALKVKKKSNLPFTKEEVEAVLKLLSSAKDFEGIRDRFIVELFYATGIRRSELIQIKETDIDFTQHTIKIVGKRNKERIILLLPLLQDSMRAYLQVKEKSGLHNEYLFVTKKGVKIYETLVYRVINSYFGRVSSKVKRSPHVLRHAFATHLLNAGASLSSVKELLGHSSLASTQVYTHNNLETIKKVFNKTHPRESY